MILIVDFSNLLYRCYYATYGRNEDNPEVIGKVLLANLLTIIKDTEPERIVIAADSKHPTYRDTLFPDYKAGRPERPACLKTQSKALLRTFKSLGIPVLRKRGYEADDLIGTLASRCTRKKIKALIYGTDKDFAQVLSKYVSQLRYDTSSKEYRVVTRKSCKAVFGVEPDRIVDLMSLLGDKVDNVPSVPGIGFKTAVRIIESGTNLTDYDCKLNKTQAKNMVDFKDTILLARRLVSLQLDAPVTLKSTRLRKFNKKTARATFTENGYDLRLLDTYTARLTPLLV